MQQYCRPSSPTMYLALEGISVLNMNVISLGCRNAPYSAPPRKEPLIKVPLLLRCTLFPAPIYSEQCTWGRQMAKGPHSSPPVCIPLTMSLCNSSIKRWGCFPALESGWPCVLLWPTECGRVRPRPQKPCHAFACSLGTSPPPSAHGQSSPLGGWGSTWRGLSLAQPMPMQPAHCTWEQAQLGWPKPEEPTTLSQCRLVN